MIFSERREMPTASCQGF